MILVSRDNKGNTKALMHVLWICKSFLVIFITKRCYIINILLIIYNKKLILYKIYIIHIKIYI